MKTYALIFIVFISTITFGQEQPEKNDARGVKFSWLPTLGFVSIRHKIQEDVVTNLGNSREILITSRDNGLRAGLKMQTGYQINSKWEAGIQGSVFFGLTNVGIFGINTHGSAAIGGYGKHFFNETWSIIGSANYRAMTNQSPGISFGIAPELMLGRRKRTGLQLGIEYSVSKRNEQYYWFDETFYPTDPFDMQDTYSGQAPKWSKGFIIDLGMTIRIK